LSVWATIEGVLFEIVVHCLIVLGREAANFDVGEGEGVGNEIEKWW
jgi:hypothetical protein